MSEILKERIKSRMAALGKNPSSVAIEAGLGRSAVRDILSGKAKNPGLVTVAAIARALDCDFDYLMGQMEEVHAQEADDILLAVDARAADVSGFLEAGVFRQILSENVSDDQFAVASHLTQDQRKRFTRLEKKPFRARRRYIGRDLYLYEMGDNSMDKLHIAKGDFLTAVVDPHDPEIPLNTKTIVIAARGAAGIAAEELSARQVIRDGGKILLRCQSQGAVFPDIDVGEKTSEANVYRLPDGGFVRIEGAVVSVTRQYPL